MSSEFDRLSAHVTPEMKTSSEFDRLSALYAVDPRVHLHEFAKLWATTLRVNDKTFEAPFPVAVRLCAMRKYTDQIMQRVPKVKKEDINRWISLVELEYRDAKVAEAPGDAKRLAAQELWLGKACEHMMNAIALSTPDSVAALCSMLDDLYTLPQQRRLLERSWGEGSLPSLLFFIPNKERFMELLRCLDHEPGTVHAMCSRLLRKLRVDGELSKHVLNDYPTFIQFHVLERVARLRFVSRAEIRYAAKELHHEASRRHRAYLRRLSRNVAFVRRAAPV